MQAEEIMAHVQEHKAHILIMMEDLIVVQTEDKEHTIAIKFIEGTVKFVKRPQRVQTLLTIAALLDLIMTTTRTLD